MSVRGNKIKSQLLNDLVAWYELSEANVWKNLLEEEVKKVEKKSISALAPAVTSSPVPKPSFDLSKVEDKALIEMLYGNIGLLSEAQRAEYCYKLAIYLGLDPASKPFDVIPVGGKMIVYANKGAAAQLLVKHKLSIEETYSGALPLYADVYDPETYVVKVKVSGPDGRVSFNMGAVSLKGLAGEARSNKAMGAHTKAHRRGVLFHCGLGFPDESEVSSIPNVGPKQYTPQPMVQQLPAEAVKSTSVGEPTEFVGDGEVGTNDGVTINVATGEITEGTEEDLKKLIAEANKMVYTKSPLKKKLSPAVPPVKL